MAHIAVIGPGAIGGTVAGALLASEKHNITICANTAFDTLTVERAGSSEAQSYPAHVVTSPDDLGVFDWVMLAVKSHQTGSAADWLRATVGSDTTLAVLQNGVEHRERVAPFIPAGTAVLPIVVQLPAQRTAPGRITTYGGAVLIASDDDVGQRFAALFAATPVKVSLTADFMTRQWEKLCLNAASGSLSTLTLNPDAIGTVPGLREVALAIVSECMAVGTAEGAKFDPNYATQIVDGFMMRTGNRGNSMYYDRRDSNVLEYDARNAVICRLGRKHGIPTPVSDTLTPLLRAVSGRPIR
ncbi:MAG TPA: 2-dehydropantoate 2-reductase [Rhizomicrobium sp.]